MTKDKKKSGIFGPGILVAAAFIGPGTVVTASLAGANFGYSLLWALLFSLIATLILQEMAGRIGLVTGEGLGENIRHHINHPVIRWLAIIIVVSAIVVGNAAYQGGNISGASLGLSHLFGHFGFTGLWSIVIGIVAFILLWTGQYQVIEKSLAILVGLMSIAFLFTFIITKPNIGELFFGLVSFDIPSGASLTVVALIGTTVVPYNLFLYSSSVGKKWQGAKHLKAARKDLFVSVSIGGLITLAILSTAATAFFGKQISINSAADLAPALQPLFGQYAEVLMAIGLFSAGISSAITAPLAAAFALNGILEFSKNDSNKIQLNNIKFKLSWLIVLGLGVFTSSLGLKPISVIWFAQVANGILLPLMAVFLLWVVNQERMGEYKNTLTHNILGALVLLVTLMLSGKSLMSAFSS